MRLAKQLKKSWIDFRRWFFISEVFSLVCVFSIPFFVKLFGDVKAINENIIYDITRRGEVFLLCIPLVIGLILIMIEKKKRSDFYFFVIVWLSISLVLYAVGCSNILQNNDVTASLISTIIKNKNIYTAYIPLIMLNISAGMVMILRDDIQRIKR